MAARLQQFRENELAQAIDRARLVHAQARKTVLLFTNQPVNLDLEVELVPLIDVLGPEGLLELLAANGGLLPLNWRWLQSQHPERFPTEARAKDFAQRAKTWAERNPLGLVLLEADRQPGARGRAGHAVRWLGVSRGQAVNAQEAKKEGSLNESY